MRKRGGLRTGGGVFCISTGFLTNMGGGTEQGPTTRVGKEGKQWEKRKGRYEKNLVVSILKRNRGGGTVGALMGHGGGSSEGHPRTYVRQSP